MQNLTPQAWFRALPILAILAVMPNPIVAQNDFGTGSPPHQQNQPVYLQEAGYPLIGNQPNQVHPHPTHSPDWHRMDSYPSCPVGNMNPPFNLGVMPYYSDMSYDASLKDRGHMWGLFGSLSTGNHEFEIGAEYMDLKFHSGAAVTQTDLAAAWNWRFLDNWKSRIGTHVIDTSDVQTDNAWIVFAGLSQYETGQWEAGLDMYVSHYEDYLPAATFYQFVPKASRTLAEFNGFKLSGEGSIYYIYADEEIGLGQHSFWSTEGRLSLERGPVNLMLYGWAGQQTFAVRNDGFLVYNLNESHEGGYGAELRLKLDDISQLRIKMGIERFEDFATRISANQRVVNFYWLISF